MLESPSRLCRPIDCEVCSLDSKSSVNLSTEFFNLTLVETSALKRP